MESSPVKAVTKVDWMPGRCTGLGIAGTATDGQVRGRGRRRGEGRHRWSGGCFRGMQEVNRSLPGVRCTRAGCTGEDGRSPSDAGASGLRSGTVVTEAALADRGVPGCGAWA
ncbi:hypothetical protein GCM10018966_028030 [Streptomyces yanii]